MAATCAPLAGTASEGRPKLGSQSRRRRSWLAVTVGLATIFATVAVTAATAPPSSAATPGIITTVAGGDAPGPVPATDVAMGASGEIAAGGGNVYVPDDQFHVIRAIATSGGSETVVAGNGTEGSLGNGGPATEAELKGPQGVAVGGGDVVIADTSNDAVRITDASTGDLLTVAGDGTAGYTGDGGPCTSAELDGPYGVALDSAGNIIIADTGNDAIRVVASSTGTYYGVAMTLGDIYTVAGGHGAGYSGDAGPATAATLDYPEDVFADSLGDIVIADTYNNAIRVVAGTTGTIYGISMTAGDIYTVAGGNGAGSSGNQGPALAAQLSSPQSVALDDAGDIIIADTGNNAIRLVAAGNGGGLTEGYIYTVAGVGRTAGFSGDGGAATSAELSSPEGVAVDGSGNLVISDFGNERVRVIAATTGTFYGISMNAGDIYTIAGNGFAGYSGDGGAATQAEMRYPSAVAVDSYGNYVIAEPYDSAIRVTANSTGTFYGVAMTAGDVYTVAGDGAPGYSGDGGPATEAALDLPFGVGMDGSGNIIIADTGNQRLRVIAKSTGTFYGQAMTAGDIYTIAGDGTIGGSGDGGPATSADFHAPWAVTVDGSGNVVVADVGNNAVRVVAEATGTFYGQAMTAGDIYTIAGNGTEGYAGDGGAAASAELDSPAGVGVDRSGNILVGDTGNSVIRVVAGTSSTFYGQAMTAGDIYTIAGNGAAGYSGDGGPATAAELGAPWGATVDGAGNVLVTDPGNSRVRVVAESTGTFYGQAMTAGDIYTIAGDTYFGYAGDGGPATSASLWDDTGVAVDNAGDVVIADFGNNRIRLVTGGPVVPALSFGPLSVTSWTVNQSGFPGTIALSGGTGSYSLTAQSGLPAGLTATLAGSTISITGTPTQAGTFASGSVTIKDSTGATATDSFSLTINPALSFGSLSVTSWTVNQAGFPGTIALSGGTGSYSLTAQSGLPAGLTATLAGSTISITGTPTQAGTFASGSLTVRDSTGATATDSFSVTINNKATPTLVTKPGATSVTLGKTAPTLTDTATVSGGSNPTGTVTFTLYYDGGASPVYTSPAVALNKGSASASYTLPGTTVQVAGTYQWDATYSGDTNNNSVSDNNDQAELVTVTAAGEFAFGAGWYTPSPSVGSTSFGFVVVPGPKSTYSGQLNVVTANRWWYQANVTSYGKTSKSEGLLAGTGSLYSWSSALNKGRGGWQLVASGVTYKATANAGTNSSASFAIVVNYTASGLPNSSSPITLARGGITII